MKYARIEAGIVAETIETDGDITKMFVPELVWLPCQAEVQAGWRHDGGGFTPPEPVLPPDTRPEIWADYRERRERYLTRVTQIVLFEDRNTYPTLEAAAKEYRQKLLDLPERPACVAAADGVALQAAIVAEYQLAVQAAVALCPEALALFAKVSK